jgi:hypothetical protein
MKEKISFLLKEAAEIEPDECHRQYLLSLSYNVLADTFYSLTPEWYSLENNRAGIIFLTDESHVQQEFWFKSFLWSYSLDWQRWQREEQQPVRKSKTKTASAAQGFSLPESHKIFDTFIFLNDEEETRRYREYSEHFDRMQAHIPAKTTQKAVPYTPSVPPVKIVNLVYSSLPGTISIVYPDREVVEQYGRFKIVIFKNLIDAYVECILKPIAGEVFQDNPFMPLTVDSRFYLSNLVMQKIAHHIGPIFTAQTVSQQTPGEKTETGNKLPFIADFIGAQLFSLVETLKSSAVGLYNTSVLLEKGLIAREDEINIYATFLVSIIDKIRKDPRLYVNQANIALFNFLLQKEAIRFDIVTKKISLQYHRFPPALEELVAVVIQRYMSPSGFLKEFGRLSPELGAILENLKDIPAAVDIDVNAKTEIPPASKKK